ncbi:MAG: hypothetical protein KF791_03955 [Verrucomicrobiae bacterium]|nr:hypothetical protein [Verrucomicrobiae bacterium]
MSAPPFPFLFLARSLRLLVVAGILVAVSGCSRSGPEESAASPSRLDLARLEQVFASASDIVRAEADRVVLALRNQEYPAALARLKALGAEPGLSAEQKEAIRQLMAELQTKAGEFLQDAAESAARAVDQARTVTGKAADHVSEAAGAAAKKAAEALLKP